MMMTVGQLQEALKDVPRHHIVLLEAGGDGAIHPGLLQRVERDGRLQPIDVRGKRSVTLSTEAS